ncbi:MAG: peptidylprolyl isomerase [bacterium]
MRPIFILFIFILALLTGFCGSTDPVICRVNGILIKKSVLLNSLPQSIEPEQESIVVNDCLEGLINKELFVQEAIRIGLDSAIAYPLGQETKALVINELFSDIARSSSPVRPQELQNAYNLLNIRVHCQVIAVREETLAHRIYRELQNGSRFESLAFRYSIHSSKNQGGDVGTFPAYYIEEPMRSAVLALQPGEFTKPVLFDSSYQIVLLLDQRTAEPPLPPFDEVKQQLEEQIKISRQRRAANEYVTQLRSRLVYNPAGLAVFYKPVDSITKLEKDLWVAIRDSSKYVKVDRLLHIARRFPPNLDTALRTYAIKRAIEEDLMFEDGLQRGLDLTPKVKEQIERYRRKLLYETLFNRMVTSQVSVSDTEISHYYYNHRDRYPQADFATVAPLIRNNLLTEKRKARYQEYLAQLRSGAKIGIDQRALKTTVAEIARNVKSKQSKE